jgi:SAM-dependent methyltransferase
MNNTCLRMGVPDNCMAIVAEGLAIRPVEEGIYSILPEGPHTHLYDRRAATYDRVVGTRLYNRVVWGASMADYAAFARQAVASDQAGMLLDAGCGSLLFTARAYLDCQRPILACDESLEMLKRARWRLTKFAGAMPDRILLLQADLASLPFRARSFSTSICMNVLHHLADAGCLVEGLKKLLAEGGHLYLTSLVRGNRLIGDRYLAALHRRGDFVEPRTGAELERIMADTFGPDVNVRLQGNMAYATAAASVPQSAA